ncbi:MAG: hypothetical protein M1834_000714 [Cirrosporium novae-zelandiae]|nr:MAG: hypothetical protein M1834_000714 [Cirrosporium novae-zelandiae]
MIIKQLLSRLTNPKCYNGSISSSLQQPFLARSFRCIRINGRGPLWRRLNSTQTKISKNSTDRSAALAKNGKTAKFGEPILLYKAAPQEELLVSSYVTGTMFLIYGAANYYTTIGDPVPGLPGPARILLGIAYVFITLFGIRCWMGPMHLVRHIWAIRRSGTEVDLKIEMRRLLPLPLIGFKTVVAPSKKVIIQTKLITTPLNVLGSGGWPTVDHRGVIQVGFEALKRVWTLENIVNVKIEGRWLRFKIDTSPGCWALDHGRALDRHLKYKPKY